MSYRKPIPGLNRHKTEMDLFFGVINKLTPECFPDGHLIQLNRRGGGISEWQPITPRQIHERIERENKLVPGKPAYPSVLPDHDTQMKGLQSKLGLLAVEPCQRLVEHGKSCVGSGLVLQEVPDRSLCLVCRIRKILSWAVPDRKVDSEVPKEKPEEEKSCPKCPDCEGSGEACYSGLGSLFDSCPSCWGTGYLPDSGSEVSNEKDG